MNKWTHDILMQDSGLHRNSFTIKNRLSRLIWNLTWHLLFRPTPKCMNTWRIFLLNCFGANASKHSIIYSSCRIWAPWNLTINSGSCLGPHVYCYSVAPIVIDSNCIVSQGAFLCTATHDYSQTRFQLFAKPIHLDKHVWICTEAFVGPGVHVRTGAVLGARGVTFSDLDNWSVYLGNPAVEKKKRRQLA